MLIKKDIDYFYQHYEAIHAKIVQDNNEINQMLKQLKHNGLLLGIVTGKAQRSLQISLKRLQMGDYFDVMITGDDVEKPKPHPE